jgi:predicted GNAT family acetyltransferase
MNTMHTQTASNERCAPHANPSTRETTHAASEKLNAAHAAEALEFLARRPLHTAYLSSLIRDNGVVSPLNRGTFYGCRDTQGALAGVALIGHAIFFEAHTEAALESFARLAQEYAAAHMLLGEQEKIERFWHYYAGAGQSPRLLAREVLLEQTWPVAVCEAVPTLRQATLDDLSLVVPVHAQMAFEESGVNPLETNAEGFRQRCARRIEQGRVWVLVEDGRLVFKADVITDAPDVMYLEGIYIQEEMRGRGLGLRCLSQLSRNLLARTRSLTVLVNERNHPALKLYARAGFRTRSNYDTIFLQKD